MQRIIESAAGSLIIYAVPFILVLIIAAAVGISHFAHPSQSSVTSNSQSAASCLPAYQETGKGSRDVPYTIPVADGCTVIVGGYNVNGLAGAYIAYAGPQTVLATVRDGFYVQVANGQAPSEFCRRIRQAQQNSELVLTVRGLQGWDSCV